MAVITDGVGSFIGNAHIIRLTGQDSVRLKITDRVDFSESGPVFQVLPGGNSVTIETSLFNDMRHPIEHERSPVSQNSVWQQTVPFSSVKIASDGAGADDALVCIMFPKSNQPYARSVSLNSIS